MFNVLLRAVILYVLVFIMVRLTGKRQVGQLQPSEFVVTLMAADIATVPMSDISVPLLWGVVGLLALMLMQIIVSYASLKSVKARKVFSGEPVVIISRGKIVEQALRHQRYNINDLLEQLRNNDVFDISEVEWALLETNGQLSVLKKDAAKTPQKCDIGLPAAKESELSLLLISGGRLLKDNLRQSGKNEHWLNKQLKEHGIDDVSQVLVAQYDTKGQLYIQKTEETAGQKV